MNVSERTREVLEWGAVLAALAERCDSMPGRERGLALPFLPDGQAARAELRRVAELWRLRDDGVPLPPLAFADIRSSLARAEREGLLSGEELGAIAELLRTALRAKRHLADEASRAPVLSELAGGLEPLPSLVREIESAIDEHGSVSDDATPELASLRARQRGLQSRTKSRIDEILHNPHFESMLQDTYVTVREGRYVLPFVASVHKQLHGIVHHKSQSGATAFMETPELVDMNNRLTVAALDVEREVERILRELTLSVCAETAVLHRDLQILAELDLLHAKARLGEALGGTIPLIDDEGALELRDARHPLMLLAGRKVIPNQLALRGGQGLVITGPNTGGKTVSMKSLGVAAMMAAAGLPVAAGPGSRVPVYSGIHADIGDTQSIEQQLSTFSGHLQQIRGILEDADNRSLVMLDELCVGTDPHEGAALAASLMESLVTRGASLVITTHYEELKAKAHVDARFVNASFGYDPSTFAPSYHLTRGIPGRSGALEVAARLGLPEHVITRARALAGERGQLDAVIRALEDERAGLEETRAQAREQELALERDRTQLAEVRRELEGRKREGYETARTEFLAELERAREEVRTAIRALQQGPSQPGVEAAKETLARIEKQARALKAAPAPEAEAEPAVNLTPGTRVFVKTMGRNGTIVEVLVKKQQVAVDFGGARILVAQSALRAPAPESTGGGARYKPGPKAQGRDDENPIRTVDTTCDLRGMRADDALSTAETFLDRALGEDRDTVFFIHGHGTGALKTALRKFLKDSPYVRRFREGHRDEGGDGVTVAWLAAG